MVPGGCGDKNRKYEGVTPNHPSLPLREGGGGEGKGGTGRHFCRKIFTQGGGDRKNSNISTCLERVMVLRGSLVLYS